MTTENEGKKEYRTYQIDIKKGHRLYRYFDELCRNSNNLYNTANFYIRQVYTALNQGKSLQPLQKEVLDTIRNNLPKMNDNRTKAFLKKLEKEKLKPMEKQKEIKLNLFDFPTKEKSFLGYLFLDCLFKTMKQNDYYSLPGQINQQVLKNVLQNWKSFFESLNDYKNHPEKYKARPSIPGYLQKGGQKETILTNQICKIKGKYLQFPKTKHPLNIGKLAGLDGKFQQVRIVSKYNHFTVELVILVGTKIDVPAKKGRCMGIDLGLDNIATAITNTGSNPILFKGGTIKSINQWYNKMRSLYYAALRNGKKNKEGPFHTKKLMRFDQRRYRRVKDFFHKISFNIVKNAKENKIDTIVIGKNEHWKQEVNLGKKNNQSFVQIPHSFLIELIKYKANAENISVILTEESYTSKASFLDEDVIPTYQSGNKDQHIFSGKRISRGMYRSKKNMLINADVNGAANILRKVVPKAFANGIAAVCSQPQVVNVL
jgi:putative transposase